MARRKSKASTPESPPPSPLVARHTTKFKRDVDRQKKRGKELNKLVAIIETLCHRRALESKHKDHALAGEWKGCCDCHIEPDWLLIYMEESGQLIWAGPDRIQILSKSKLP